MSYDQIVWVMNFLSGVAQGLVETGLQLTKENFLERIMKFRSINVSPQVNQVCDLSFIFISTIMDPNMLNIYTAMQNPPQQEQPIEENQNSTNIESDNNKNEKKEEE